MIREALKKLIQEQLVSEIVRLYSAMEILERQIIQMSDSIENRKNRIEELETENKILKQQHECLKNILETAYIPESAESIMRKYGFSEEFIQDAIRMNETIEKNVRKEIFKNENDVDKDKLISELQDQHQ